MSDTAQSPAARLANFALLAAVFLAFALPRWAIVEQSATADETKWVARAANFSAALSRGDLAGTYQSEHPGVTTMWAGTLGLRTLFPAYTAQDPGQLEPYELDNYLKEHGFDPLQALVAGRRIMVLFNALALTLVFAYARRLLDLQTALLAAIFGALSPFLIAHTHLMHLDGLAGSLMVLSLVAFLSYSSRLKNLDLIVSGVAAGLAWLTKTPAFALGPIMLIISLLIIWNSRDNSQLNWSTVRRPLLTLLAWGSVGLLTFVLFWPAMWVEPLSTLSHIFGEALGYAGGGHGDPVFFNGTIYENGRIPATVFTFYPVTAVWRSTPVILMGVLLVFPALWQRWSPLNRKTARRTIIALLLYALLFTLFMTLGDKKFDRYLIPIYSARYLVAAAGWVGLVRAVAGRWFSESRRKPVLIVLLLGLIAAWQLLALGSTFPYPLSYYNPLLGGSKRAPQVMQIGWGEGLDAAGRYLSEKPESDQLTVASWYRSALAYYFDGPTLSIKANLSPEEEAAVKSADYAVIYSHQWQRGTPAALLDYFETLVPEHVITINGLEYARIYDLRR